MSTTQNTSASYNTTETHPTALLVWDAPNLDMGLGAILGSRPTAAHRPRFDAVGKWLIDEAERVSNKIGSDVLPEATVFTNVNPGSAEIVRPGSRRCAMSVSRSSQSRRSKRTPTLTPT